MAFDHYETCNAIWRDAGVSWTHNRLTEAEARRMATVLWKLGAPNRRPSRLHIRPVWMRQGVRRLVHDVSHRVFRWVRPASERRNHCFAHSTFEKMFSEEAIKRGWHVAKPSRAPRPKKAAADPKVVKRTRAELALKRWRTKQKRAATAIKKLERSLRRMPVATQGEGVALAS